MIDIGERLVEFGDHLDLADGEDLSAAVLARLDREGDAHPSRARYWLSAAAAVLVVTAALAVLIPDSRSAIADWFGLDGVEIDQDPDLTVPADPTPFDQGAPGTTLDVEGTEVLVASFDGRLEEPFIDKALSAGSAIERVDVDGSPGLWIDGAPHVVTYLNAFGHIDARRIAGNTLLWQDGDVIHRVEGFRNLEAALAYAEKLP